MNKKTNIIYIILIIVILSGFTVYKVYDNKKTAAEEERIQALREQYIREAKEEAAEKAAKERYYAAIRESIPGIACWGDDMTYGKGGIESAYPHVLENLLYENGYMLPVYNNGVSGEDSLTVLGRQGAIPYVAEAFKLKDVRDLVEIKIKSSYNGEEVNPLLRKRNPGVNPCSIAGINGTLYGYVNSADLDKVDTFYFARDNTGASVDVPDDTPIITSGNNYKDFINILAIGEHGGWKDNEELVDQNERFVEFLKGSKNENSYLILGMTKGDSKSNAEIEKMMSDTFKEHYINVREYLTTSAMNDMGLTPTDRDKKAMEIGKVPPSLMFDDNNLNDHAYEAIGKLVYNKLAELNYIKK